MSGLFTVITGLLCDAVRREDNGKLLIIGAYSGIIAPAKLPANLILCCIIIAEGTSIGEAEIEFEALLDGQKKAEGKGTLKLHKTGRNLFPIPNIALREINAGTLSFRIREDGKDWQPIVEIPVGPKDGA